MNNDDIGHGGGSLLEGVGVSFAVEQGWGETEHPLLAEASAPGSSGSRPMAARQNKTQMGTETMI